VNKFSPDLLIYVLIFAAIVLFKFLMNRFGPQPQPHSPQDQPVPEIMAEDQEAADFSPLPAASDTRFGRTGAPSASTPPPRGRFARRSLMGTRREMQNAIVIATILGPCRAFEPHDLR